MRRICTGLFAAALFSLGAFSMLTACGNGSSSEPPVTSLDPAANSRLQFAVGVATISYNSGTSVAYGLNTVETLRQKDGLSGTLYNVPMIIGPSGFAVSTSVETGEGVQSAGSDIGTNHITWGTLNQGAWLGAQRGPKQPTTGAFGYGLCACNSDAGPGNGFTPLYEAFNLPIYGEQVNLFWYGGPPAFPAAGPQLVAQGWEGYSLGFTDFAVAPTIGTYHLYAAVPPSYDTPQNPTPSPGPDGTPTPPPGILAAGAQLTSTTGLQPFARPALRPDRKGGGTIAVTVPNGVSEALVIVFALHDSGKAGSECVLAHTSDAYYTVVTHKRGAQVLALPDDLGPLTQSGEKSPTICAEGTYSIYAVGADWPLYESSYPNNLGQLPSITAPNGQADITTSDVRSASYP